MSELSQIVAEAIGHGLDFEVNLKNENISISIDGPTVHKEGYGSVTEHHEFVMKLKAKNRLK